MGPTVSRRASADPGPAPQTVTTRTVAAVASAGIAAAGLRAGLSAAGLTQQVRWTVMLTTIVVLLVAEAAAGPALRRLAGRGSALWAIVVGLAGQLAIAALALWLVADIRLTRWWDLPLVLGTMAAITAAGRWFVGASDAAYVVGHSLRRAQRAAPGPSGARGLVVVQLDGVSAVVLRRAVASGQVPYLASWLSQGTHLLRGWWVPVPSTTPASQAGVLHGDDRQVPGFRWWDRTLGRLVVSNRAADAALVQRRFTEGRGLLRDGGVAASTIFSGEASESFLVFSRAAQRGGLGPGSSYLPLFASPFLLPRTLVLTQGEMVKEIFQARRQKLRAVEPRIPRRLSYVALRGLTNVLLRTLNLVLVTDAMSRGAPIIFVDFVDYDEIAHHAGPERPEAMRALEGQRLGGGTLADRVQRLMADDAVTTLESANGDDWGPLNALLAATFRRSSPDSPGVQVGPDRRPAQGDAPAHPDVVVVGGGNLAMAWFPGWSSRPDLARLDRRWPGLVPGLALTSGVAAVMVADDRGGTVVVGAHGVHRLDDGDVQGVDPLAQFGPGAAEDLRRLSSLEHCGDLVVLSTVDSSGTVHAFEGQVGSHGGIGGLQNNGLLLHPVDLPVDDDLLTPVGAERMFTSPVAIHDQIERWRRAQRTLLDG